MNLIESGKLLSELRRSKGMTQKQVADKLGVLPKTVSKWETGHGFPDVSSVSTLAEVLEVSVDTILSGNLAQNESEVGNMKRIKFYVCPHCGNILQTTGESSITCCGKPLSPLKAISKNNEHEVMLEEVDNDFYITFSHEMLKEHYISFAALVTYDRVITVKLYPEQDPAVRVPRMYGGKLFYYCINHGFFEYDLPRRKSNLRN